MNRPSRKAINHFGCACFLLVVAPALAQNYSKTEVVTYHYNTAKWVLGQTATVTDASTGLVESATTFDPTTAVPLTQSAFGKLRQTLTYNADGTVVSVKDGNNRTTSLSSWKRGVPQTIQYADGTSQSAVVNDAGWLTAVTDQNGFTTSYGYDAMGRMSLIVYPSGDPVAWSNTNRSVVQVAGTEYGIPAGHWRETVTTGNAVKITYFDGMWRPLLVREYDAASQAATERFTRMAYDAGGRLAFKSYPSTSSNPSTGVWTEHDPLNRPSSSTQDSELGPLTTLMAYGPGFTTTVTNPKGHATTTSYMTYDQPSTDWPVVVQSPESAVTYINRDVFGKPTALTRGGGGWTPITRYYAYNPQQELCKQWEPETRGSIFAYDGAGNLVQSAAGLNGVTADSSQCNTDQFGAGRTVTRTYDARNRLSTLAFPDGNGNQSWTYTPDGLPSTVSTNNGGNIVTNAYGYNRRRMLVSEAMVPDATYTGWAIGYGYNGLGHVVAETNPGNATVNYVVNALGQTTQVSAGVPNQGTSTVVASNASYFPNGALKQFTYGNGIVHTMSQNARQLPSRSTDGSVLDLGTSFDANGNVAGITDYATGKHTRSMTYDTLDRLTSANSPMFGTASYSYDTLDNLRLVQIAGAPPAYGADRIHHYCYGDGNNRLLFVRNGPNCGYDASPAVQAMEYDVQGNLRSKNGTTYTFDYGNRLRTTAGLTYRYDAEGRRVRQDSAGSQLVYSFYAKGGRLVWQRDDPADKRINNVYLAGSLVAELSRPTMSITETLTYVHTDALGSPIAKTNSVGSVIETSEYEPYGKLLNRPNDNRAGYTGHVMDSASGLTYMQQRYYDPSIGRFLSVDPVTAYGGDYRFFNRYAYANNNPYKFTDPDGRSAVTKFIKQTIKHEGNVVQAAIDVGSDVVTVFAPSSTPMQRIESAISLVSPVDISDVKAIKKGLEKAGDALGGRKGGLDTRAQNKAIGDAIESRGGKVEGGFGGKETQFGSGKGSRYSDGSATDQAGNRFEVQTVDTRANGTMTNREIGAARDIAQKSNGPVVCVPKKSC